MTGSSLPVRARRSVEELCRNRFRERVVAFLLPPRDEVVSVVDNHFVKLRDFVGAVLQVGVHSNNHVAQSAFESHVEGRRLAVVATEAHTLNVWVLLAEVENRLPRIVGRAVVDKDNFVGVGISLHHTADLQDMTES